MRYKELRKFPAVGDKPIWMTEWAQRYPHGDVYSDVEYGMKILNALRLGAEAWMVFEWCHPSGNQSGLISTDWSAQPPRQRYWRSKAYYVFQQIANTTPIGSKIVNLTPEQNLNKATERKFQFQIQSQNQYCFKRIVKTTPKDNNTKAGTIQIEQTGEETIYTVLLQPNSVTSIEFRRCE